MVVTKPLSTKLPTPLVRRMFQHGDVPFKIIIVLATLFTLALVVGVGVMLWLFTSVTRMDLGFSFVTSKTWNPTGSQFGALPFVVGTLITSILALIISVPLGVGIAIFLAELCPARLRAPLGVMVELLAAVPSVVFGLWGIFVFVPTVVKPLGNFLKNAFGTSGDVIDLPLFHGPFYGFSYLAAGAILAVMVLPTIAAISRDVLLAVPGSQREGAFGIGCTRWEAIWQVVLPYGLSGILGAVILGLGRALGETMAVTMVIGNVAQLSGSLLSPGYTMASVIANEWGESSTPAYASALLEIGLLLFIMSVLLNLLARLLVWSVQRRNPQQHA